MMTISDDSQIESSERPVIVSIDRIALSLPPRPPSTLNKLPSSTTTASLDPQNAKGSAPGRLGADNLQTAGNPPPLPWHFSWLFRRAVLRLISLSFRPDLFSLSRWEIPPVLPSPLPPLLESRTVSTPRPPPDEKKSRLCSKPGRPWSEPYKALVAFRAPCTTIGTTYLSSCPFSSPLARHAATGDVI